MKITAAILLFLLYACGGGGQMQQKNAMEDDGMVKVTQPSWYDLETEDEQYWFVYGEGASRDKNVAYDEAKANASGEMVSMLEQNIEQMVTNMRDRAGTGDNEQILKSTSTIFRSVSSKVVSGLQVVQREPYIDKKSGQYTYYVMMKLPKKSIKEKFTQALRNEEALYTKFKEKQMLDELDKQIDKFEAKKKEN
ncbi:MAG: LPP20 family lipoprotein [Calditrichaeota bacterium]|nr:LPP20 family lipoprotein [Calditrichota bacterium]